MIKFIDFVGYITGGAGLLGGASAYFYGSRAKSIIALQEEEIKQRIRNNQELQAENIAFNERVKAQDAYIGKLEVLVTRAPDLAKLTLAVDKLTKSLQTNTKAVVGNTDGSAN